MASHPARTAGLALGILYLVEAVFATGILFAIWPILGGIFAAALLRWSPDRLTPGAGAKAAAKAGLIAALVLLICGTPLTYFLLQHLGEEPGAFGISLGLPLVSTLLILLAAYSLLGIVVAAAAGALTGLLAGERAVHR